MPFKKGHKKIGGKKKGTPNKATQDHRDLINKLISSPEQLLKDLASLEPKERIDATIKLLEYTTPKQSRVETNVTAELGLSSIIFEDAKKDQD